IAGTSIASTTPFLRKLSVSGGREAPSRRYRITPTAHAAALSSANSSPHRCVGTRDRSGTGSRIVPRGRALGAVALPLAVIPAQAGAQVDVPRSPRRREFQSL